ncbi:MAG: hypothetical protein MRECE_5c005 [Mycoplasmataceae bacterium CE_OT135]|nr:MAG: hypothetical protein MRECE_5c005 [Mycoplasmataceae bacterium CE_OT135]
MIPLLQVLLTNQTKNQLLLQLSLVNWINSQPQC